MKNLLKVGVTLSALSLLAACGSTPETVDELNANIPEWVLNPVLEDGLAASTCMPSSGHFSVDQKNVTAQARQSLAQQIGIRVKGLDKTYQERVDVDGKAAVGNTFSSVSKQLTDEMLVGSRPIKTAFAEFDGKRQVCVLVGIGAASTKELFDNIIKESERNVSIDDEKVMYQEFKAHKAQLELEAEIEKNNN